MTKRVVITGIGGVTALGNDADTIYNNVKAKKTAVRFIEDWDEIKGLHSKLGAPVENFELPSHYNRKKIRSMGRVAQFSTLATELAIKQAQLSEEQLTNGRAGIAYGSCSGSTNALASLVNIITDKEIKNIAATTYIKAMSHTCAVNIALTFGITGRIIPTASACTSSSQAIGYAYETIKDGYQDVMIAGGAEELCPSQVAIFDTLYATSQKNETPDQTPRPFDKDRDGLVLGEGGCTFILESLEHAQARGAEIIAEIVGFGVNCDAVHVTQPTAEKMCGAMDLALESANLNREKIGYVNAHGTATNKGDIAESNATELALGNNTPISSLKGNFGHSLGACGALEAWMSLEMMKRKAFLPTTNLDNVDPECAALDYIIDQPRSIDCDYVMSNNFAFGGINTSLIFKRFS